MSQWKGLSHGKKNVWNHQPAKSCSPISPPMRQSFTQDGATRHLCLSTWSHDVSSYESAANLAIFGTLLQCLMMFNACSIAFWFPPSEKLSLIVPHIKKTNIWVQRNMWAIPPKVYWPIFHSNIPGSSIWYLFLPLLKNTRIVEVLAEKRRSWK